MSVLRNAALAVAIGWLAVALTWAQSSTGSLSGTVKDPADAVAPGVKVIAKHEPTGREFMTKTSETGLYAFPNLVVGPYSLVVEHPGFKKLTRGGIVIAVSSRAVLDLTLEVGEVQQSIVVSGTPPLLAAATSELSTNFRPRFMRDAPLFVGGGMRNPEAFVSYMPGVNTGSASSGPNASTEVSVNGGLIRSKEVLLDGASVTGQSGGGTLFDFPAVEELGEFAVLTNNFSAEYGRTGGGIEVFVTKSGTNSLHGSVFDFLRNDKLDSAGWAVNSVPGEGKERSGRMSSV